MPRTSALPQLASVGLPRGALLRAARARTRKALHPWQSGVGRARRRADGAIHVKHDDLGRLPLIHPVDPGAGDIGEVVDWRQQLGFNLKVLTCSLNKKGCPI